MISEKGNYKVVDCHLTSKMNPYLELLHGIPVKQGTYLAPELLLVNDLRSRICARRTQNALAHQNQIFSRWL